MAHDHVNFAFKCPLCGGTTLALPEGYTDDSVASCDSCGAEFGRWGDIKAQAQRGRDEPGKTPFKGFRR